MFKNPTAKHWREINSKKDSEESLNDSVNSNRSSLSSGYNRFHFNRSVDTHAKRSSAFHFTARNRNQPYDISILKIHQHEQLLTPLHLNQQTPVRDTGESTPRQPPTNSHNHFLQITKQLQELATTLKNTIESVGKQIRDLKMDWDRSMKKLLKMQISFENTAILELRDCLSDKQREIQQISRDCLNFQQLIAHPKNTPATEESQRIFEQNTESKLPSEIFPKKPINKSAEELGNLSKLPISRVDVERPGGLAQFSRSNTLNSLLEIDSLASPRPQRPLLTLREAVQRMRETLSPEQ